MSGIEIKEKLQKKFAHQAKEGVKKKTERETDQELVDRFKAGHKKAHDVLQLKHQEKVKLLILKKYGNFFNESDAEDLTQDAFVRSYKELHNFRGDSAYSSWLCRIAINLAKNEIVLRNRQVQNYGASSVCLLYTSPSPRDGLLSRMPSSA